MKTIIFWACTILASGYTHANGPFRSLPDSSLSGKWEAKKNGDKLSLTLIFSPGADGWTYSDVFNMKDFQTEENAGQSELTLRREPGNVVLTGRFENERGVGTYAFVENGSFRSFLQSRGMAGISPQEMMLVLCTGIDRNYFEFMEQSGIPISTGEQLKQLAWQHMTRGFVKQYVDEIGKYGYTNISLDKLIELKFYGIYPDYIDDVNKMGYGTLPVDKIYELRHYNIGTDYIASLKSVGYEHLPLDKAIELGMQRVTAKFISDIQALGFKDIPLDKVIELKMHDVSAEYIRQKQLAGYQSQSLDYYLDLKLQNK